MLDGFLKLKQQIEVELRFKLSLMRLTDRNIIRNEIGRRGELKEQSQRK